MPGESSTRFCTTGWSTHHGFCPWPALDASPRSDLCGERPETGRLVTYDGEAPLTVIAPTGSGKGRDVLIPMLLTYPGPVIAVDLKANFPPSAPAKA